MAVQSISLSSSTTACNFNSSTVEKINLNGTEIWTKPSSGFVTTSFGETSPYRYTQVYWYSSSVSRNLYGVYDKVNKKVYSYISSGGSTTSVGWYSCDNYCNGCTWRTSSTWQISNVFADSFFSSGQQLNGGCANWIATFG